MKKIPRLHLHNHQNALNLSLPRLQRQLEIALQLLPLRALKKLPSTLEFSFVTPNVIARVHDDFMSDPSPTDVITFHHGEILICPVIARQQSRQSGLPVEQEIFLYALHALLHLIGHTDATSGTADLMAKLQEDWLKKALQKKRHPFDPKLPLSRSLPRPCR
jgi:probable rRNA maturation factor